MSAPSLTTAAWAAAAAALDWPTLRAWRRQTRDPRPWFGPFADARDAWRYWHQRARMDRGPSSPAWVVHIAGRPVRLETLAPHHGAHGIGACPSLVHRHPRGRHAYRLRAAAYDRTHGAGPRRAREYVTEARAQRRAGVLQELPA